MSDLVTFLNVLHLALTAGFVVVTFALLGVSILNRLRVRHAVFSWKPGRWRSIPLGPVVFALLIAGFEGIAVMSGRGIPVYLLAGYGAGSVAWFAAAYISSTVIVSECGIVANIHRRDHSVAWGRVLDYFEYRSGFVFLYRDDQGKQARLQVEVPCRLRAELSDLVDYQLRHRFERTDRRTHGKTALEG